MDHYFTDNPPKHHDRREIPFRFLGISLKLITDAGVFSKEHVDEGTKLLLEQVHQKNLRKKVLDLGCGYGVIALTLKALDKSLKVIGVDINSYAIKLAQENAKLNNLDISFIHSDGIGDLGQFDEILLNPPIRAGKKVVYKLFDEAYNHLHESGRLFVVMRKQHGAPSAIKYCQNLFQEVTIIKRNRGFWVFECSELKIDNLQGK